MQLFSDSAEIDPVETSHILNASFSKNMCQLLSVVLAFSHGGSFSRPAADGFFPVYHLRVLQFIEFRRAMPSLHVDSMLPLQMVGQV